MTNKLNCKDDKVIMVTKKIMKLRNHWYYTAIGESHRDSSVICRDTAAALDEIFEHHRRKIKFEMF